MNSTLILAVVSMITALSAYTAGVWGERRSRRLKPVHLAAFWTGFVFDSLGTETMRRIALDAGVPGGLNAHAVLGALALVLMGVHAVWATVTLFKRDNPLFHRFSLGVWSLWLVPFSSGMIMAMSR